MLSAGCTQGETRQAEQVNQNQGEADYRGVSPKQLKTMLESEDIFLVDVHIPEQEHIRGTDAFIPYNQVERQKDKLPEDRSTKIVVYCRTGPMSFPAIDSLHNLGYTNIYYLKGGKMNWQRAGYSVP